jgi:hypothetical protein
MCKLTARTDGMLLPPLCSQADYVRLAQEAGLNIFAEPFDISKKVSKTWYAYHLCARVDRQLTLQGYFLVTCSESSTVGIRNSSGSGWPSIFTGFSSHEKRICQWNLQICRDGIPEMIGHMIFRSRAMTPS